MSSPSAFIQRVHEVVPMNSQNTTTVTLQEDICYHHPHEQELHLELYLPRVDDVSPVLIYAHGGKYKVGIKGGDNSQFLPELATHGIACIDIEYRRIDDTPDASFPSPIRDMKTALKWARTHADEYQFDSTRIHVGDVSAGAHLAAFVSVTPDWPEYEPDDGRGDTTSQVNGIIGISGIYDLPRYCKQVQKTGEDIDPTFERFFGGTFTQTPELYEEASPVTHVSAQTPPTLLLHGTDDELLPYDQALRYREALADNDVWIELFSAEGGPHTFFYSITRGVSRRRLRCSNFCAVPNSHTVVIVRSVVARP